MKRNKILSFIITLGEGVFLLWIGVRGIQQNIPDIMNYTKLAGGLFLIIIGITNLIWRIFGVKNEKTPLYVNIGLGVLIFITGLSITNNSLVSSAIMVPGSLLIFINFPILLRRKIPKDKNLGFKGFLLAGLIFIAIMVFIYLFAYLTR